MPRHRDAPEKKSRAMPWIRRAKHRIGNEWRSNALEKKCQVMLWRGRAKHRKSTEKNRTGKAQKRTAQEKLRLPRTCIGKVGYGCAQTCEGKATAKNRCTTHWS